MNSSNPRDNRQDDKAQPLQGEGNHAAARRYDQAATDFTRSGKVDEAARQARPGSAEEERSLKQAEEQGASHAKR